MKNTFKYQIGQIIQYESYYNSYLFMLITESFTSADGNNAYIIKYLDDGDIQQMSEDLIAIKESRSDYVIL